MDSSDSLATADKTKERLEALTLFRVVGVSLLLLGVLIFDVSAISQLTEARSTALLFVIVGTYLLSILYAIVIRQLRETRPFAMVQVSFDVIISSALVVLSGGFQSVFLFLFHIIVVNAATVLGRAAGFAVATATTAVIIALAGADVGWFSTLFPYIEESSMSTTSVWFLAVVNSSAAYILAFLAGYLSDHVGQIRTELGEREQDVQRLRKLNRNILDSMNSGVMSVDGNLNTLFVNRAGLDILELEEAEIVNRSLDTVVPPIADILENLSPDLSAAARFECEFHERYLGFSLSSLRLDRDDEAGFIVIFQDLTEIRGMEQNVRRAERLAAVGQLAASIAHEIRNPLASISGSVEMLEENSDVTEDDATLLRIIVREVDRLNALITEFLDYARPRDINLTPVTVGEVFEEVLALFETQDGPQVTRRGDWDVQVLGESESLTQVFWNLVNNANDALTDTENPEIVVDVQTTDGIVLVSVSDNGPGIPDSVLPHVFEPFYTTKANGTGLGLASIYRIIEEHGGMIEAGPSDRGGAEFVYSLHQAP